MGSYFESFTYPSNPRNVSNNPLLNKFHCLTSFALINFYFCKLKQGSMYQEALHYQPLQPLTIDH